MEGKTVAHILKPRFLLLVSALCVTCGLAMGDNIEFKGAKCSPENPNPTPKCEDMCQVYQRSVSVDPIVIHCSVMMSTDDESTLLREYCIPGDSGDECSLEPVAGGTYEECENMVYWDCKDDNDDPVKPDPTTAVCTIPADCKCEGNSDGDVRDVPGPSELKQLCTHGS